MNIKRTDEKLIEDIEELNKQPFIFKNEKSKIYYIGIYEVLDELIRRIKEAKLFDRKLVDDYCDIFIKVYRELGE